MKDLFSCVVGRQDGTANISEAEWETLTLRTILQDIDCFDEEEDAVSLSNTSKSKSNGRKAQSLGKYKKSWFSLSFALICLVTGYLLSRCSGTVLTVLSLLLMVAAMALSIAGLIFFDQVRSQLLRVKLAQNKQEYLLWEEKALRKLQIPKNAIKADILWVIHEKSGKTFYTPDEKYFFSENGKLCIADTDRVIGIATENLQKIGVFEEKCISYLWNKEDPPGIGKYACVRKAAHGKVLFSKVFTLEFSHHEEKFRILIPDYALSSIENLIDLPIESSEEI